MWCVSQGAGCSSFFSQAALDTPLGQDVPQHYELPQALIDKLSPVSDITPAVRLRAVHGMHAYVQELEKSSLFPAQQVVMHDILDFFVDSDRGYVAMPTGSGKTRVFSEVLRATGIPSLVVVPTRVLVAQTLAELVELGITARQAKNPLMLTAAERAANPQVEVITYMALAKAFSGPASRYTINPEKYGIVVLDEAHHAMAHGANQALSRFGHAFQIGFTATPDYSAARQLQDYLPKIIHEITINEAVQMGLITKFATVMLRTGTDLSNVRYAVRDYDVAALEKAINTRARNAVVADFFAATMPEKKTIFSCNSIEHAQDMAAELRARGIRAAAVYGNMPQFDDVMRQFEAGTITALTNNKVLTEGFNDRGVEVVVGQSPTLSFVRSQQRTGRGLRLNPANPDKELIIVECLDDGNQYRPAFFFTDEIAGTTGNTTASAQTLATLAQLAAYKSNTLSVFVTDKDILASVAHLPLRGANKSNGRASGLTKAERVKTGKLSMLDVMSLGNGNFDLSWQDDALCAETDPELFFPEKGGTTRFAKDVCKRCDVQEECLDYALAADEHFGIWGGRSKRERRVLKKAKAVLTEVFVDPTTPA